MLDASRGAILRTYTEMRRRGASDSRAFEAAVTVFRHRQPELMDEDAKFVVSDWITQELEQ